MRTWVLLLTALAAQSPVSPSAASPESPKGEPSTGDSPTPNVVGGNPAEAGRWNDAAAIFIGDDLICTGTLIAPDVVVTAGHCFEGLREVKLGGLTLEGEDGETIRIERQVAYTHSDPTAYYDVAVLMLERPSSFTPRVLASGCVLDRFLANGAPVAIVGWGAIDPQGRRASERLMQGETSITDFDCTSARDCNEGVSPGGELAAGGGGVDSCFGDSGGPLYLKTDIGDFLIGITSRGFGNVTPPCGVGGIYTRADAVLDWIEQESGRSIPRANCNERPVASADITELDVNSGGSVVTLVTVTDPDAANTHRFHVSDAAEHGQASVDDQGAVEYTADRDYDGADEFTIRVADDGIPSLSSDVVFQVTVHGDGCGCRASGQPPGTALLVALAALIGLSSKRRRRRG